MAKSIDVSGYWWRSGIGAVTGDVDTLRKKGLNGCESPDADDYFEHSPLSEDRFSKLNEDSDFIFKRGPALNKKEHRGCDSPDPDTSYVLTPHTEEKYKKINEEFDNMMRNHKIAHSLLSKDRNEAKREEFTRNQMNTIDGQTAFIPGLPAQNFSMSVTVPVSNPNTLTYSNPGSSLVSPSLAAGSSLTDTTMLSPPQGSLHRNVSPGAPQRPPSAGSAGELGCRPELPGAARGRPGPPGASRSRPGAARSLPEPPSPEFRRCCSQPQF
ncbi:hypothetical protein DV515_00006460 [Chloebia gouldiae]|uniref:Holliday junction regulator protein family C-terminal domain-containing protein n=1 Tax=Chloebia gouldiae TaxID=44316 RepID=A0A3L8SKA5_CHLGU|nr:hypothetical protein DV515_00006460 [Chloebia gouldiae]